MKTDLKFLNDLIVEIAVCQLAVDDFDPADGQLVLAQAKDELDRLRLDLIHHIETNGLIYRLIIGADAADRAEGVDISKLSRAERRKVLFGK